MSGHGYSSLFVISESTHLDATALHACLHTTNLIVADFDVKASLSYKSEQKLRSYKLTRWLALHATFIRGIATHLQLK